MESEKKTERYLCDQVKALGGLCIKNIKPRGFPDRTCILPQGDIAFIELKSEGRKPEVLQIRWIQKLKSMGHVALVIDTKAKVDELIQLWRAEYEGGNRMFGPNKSNP